jgi:hypothetical protein
MFIDDNIQNRVRQRLLDKYGEELAFRIERGVNQAAGLWTEEDGNPDEFEAFCEKYFIGSEKEFEEAFDKFDTIFESIDGHFNAMQLNLREPLDLDLGELRPVDILLGEYDPSAHLTDDLYKNKLAFVVLINFPHYDLNEKKAFAEAWSPRDWALTRMGDRFLSRVPASVQQKRTKVLTEAEAYISEYNIFMGNLRDRKGEQLFPENLKLISHWGIRDELKIQYGQDDGLPKQKMIYSVMQKIITQDIPGDVINNSDLVWNVFENSVTHDGKPIDFAPEPNNRYHHILNVFRIMQDIDKYYPSFPTYIRRKSELEREMPEDEVENLFTELLSSPELLQVASLIKKRLGRDLEPFDIWYDGFKPRSGLSKTDLDAKVAEKYPDLGAYRHDVKNILMSLGFSAEQALFLAPRIQVDATRGAGHAWGAEMKEGKAHLRTRIAGEGMDYKGYNIALHELGHTVEQTFTIHKVDYHSIQGVPFSGFTEAFAFIFQGRDLELLGMQKEDKNARHLKTLDNFWGTAEIMAVSLVDMKIWHWLYNHPDASAEALKKATMDIASDIWNRFYADAFGHYDETILAIYSHMIDYPLYLADYPLGHVIQFQIEKHMEGKNMADEMERMCSAGNILPQVWMKEAVGSEISVEPMLEATRQALEIIS